MRLTTAAHTIFISKSLADSRELATFCTINKWILVAESGISITIHPFEQPKNFDVLFFGSKNSALAYFEQHTPPAPTNIACAGEATAKLVRFLGYSTSFVASTVNEEEVQRFAAWVGEKKVFYPCSDKSLKSFGAYLSPIQQIFTVAYSTQLLEYTAAFTRADIHVFTSPSNVEATLINFPNHAYHTVIAWGESTEKAIQKHLSFQRIIVLEQPTFGSLIAALEVNF